MDGFGQFNLEFGCSVGFTASADKVTFTVTDNDVGAGRADASAVLVGNGTYLAAAHIAVAPLNNPTSGALATGFAANGSAPDGGTTVAMLGSALVGLGLLRRKFSKA